MIGFNGVLIIKYKSGERKDIFPNNYLEDVEATGVNPLGIDLEVDDNPVIVIGMLK